MKKIVLAMALAITSMAQAKTVNYDVFKSEKTVESTSRLGLNVFDFKMKKVTKSKTTIVKKCHSTGPVKDRPRTGLCSKVSTQKVTVAQVTFGYRPFGTTGRDGEVTNGKKMYFVSFNFPVADFSEEELNTIKNSKRSVRKALAKDLFTTTVDKNGRYHTVSVYKN